MIRIDNDNIYYYFDYITYFFDYLNKLISNFIN